MTLLIMSTTNLSKDFAMFVSAVKYRGFAYPLHALVLVVRRLLDAVDVVLEGGVAPGVVLLLLNERG